ncbi:MAG: glycosyltransferase family 2 protein [Chloroflexota bacterium]|nr:glycosyltransferase family 2 protein [Chloroflexota bacterium]MDQ5865985.1 glycosyltransferase family 2 protein [Chloroflexota bacterium]
MSAPSKPRLTVAALAWREGEHLAKCFASLRHLRELTNVRTLIVLDACADLATADIAHHVADKVLSHPFENFSRQRNFALDAVPTDWVFFIDPDERMTGPLAVELVEVMAAGEAEAYRVPRRNILFGKEVRHTGWSPDYQVRLLRTDRCRYDETQAVHEVPLVDGSTGTLKHPLIHFNYATWRQFIAKQRSYAPLEARALHAAGHRAHLRSFIGQPAREFKRRFFEYRGYKDGVLGFQLSLGMSAYRLLTYWHLYRLQKAPA